MHAYTRVLLQATRASGFARADRAVADLIMPVCGLEAPQPVCSGDRPAAPLAPSRGVRYRPRFLACCCRSLTSCALARSHADAVAPARVHTRQDAGATALAVPAIAAAAWRTASLGAIAIDGALRASLRTLH